ncbi:MAG: M48 family metallopeptidase [Pseudomonadota bacterium]
MHVEHQRVMRAGLPGGRLGIIILALVALGIYYFSNQQTNPYTGEREFNTVPLDTEVRLGAQSYMQILGEAGSNVLCKQRCSAEDQQILATVQEIGERLRVAAIQYERELLAAGAEFTPVAETFDWRFNVIRSNQPNAFCLPGGYVAVYTGLLDVTGNADGRVDLSDLKDVDKLAVVIGHELGHALAHHGAKRMSNSQLAQLGGAALAVGMGGMDVQQQMMVRQAFGVAAQGGILAFSRDHETQADQIGLNLLIRACYDPREAPELWQRMGSLGGQRPPEWMSTHPASETRAQNFERWMPEAVAEFEKRCLGRTGAEAQ